MTINVFGNSSSSYDNGNKIDTNLFVKNLYLRSNYIEANIEEDLDLKNQYRIKTLPDPISIREADSKNYVDNLFNDPGVLKNTTHIDLNNRNITNAIFIQVNQHPQIDSHLTAKLYVDNATDDLSLIRNKQNNDFKNYNLTNINSITLNKQAENDKEIIRKTYVDQFHDENERSRRDLGFDFYDELNDLVKNNQHNDVNDKKLSNLDSITINRNPTSDNEVSNKKCIDASVRESTVVRFNQTLQNFFKVYVGNDTYNLTKYDEIQLIDLTEIRSPNIGFNLLPKWRIKILHENNGAKIGNFLKFTT